MIKKIVLALAVALVLLQLYRQAKNIQAQNLENDIRNTISVPEPVIKLLEKSCYDCHSNHSEYPWYTNIQPLGMWIQNHINEGKSELNFSEFKTYSAKKQTHKLKEILHEVEDDEMPLTSYLIIHRDAKLSTADKERIKTWLVSIPKTN
jgi:hypothetical protein